MEKLYAVKDIIKDDNVLIESEDIVIDDDRSGVCVVVNEVESNSEGESDTDSSSDSDS